MCILRCFRAPVLAAMQHRAGACGRKRRPATLSEIFWICLSCSAAAECNPLYIVAELLNTSREHVTLWVWPCCSRSAGYSQGQSAEDAPFGRNWAAEVLQPPRPRRPRNTGALPNRLLGALALLRDPAELDGEGLGRAATAAAREGLDDEAWWAALTKRTKELSDSLAMHDVSLILNGMARSRRLDKQLVQALLPRICANLVYLTSAHLAMLASSVAKAEIHNAQFTNLLTRELKAVDTVCKLQLLPYLADGFKLARNSSQDAQ
ncbi:hypothetical protein AK812_SmicGene21098 [Symbiodinium microadriaticum]|uniref:Uncharacterized protein n=1 Tax=Symbiodinium microadriaticum TaxID=2951 RepID=A0A1Q9DN75_SYMMI|nr:hypothetical protein AK812_SmicGene21098 [Symbiodinium microadriaticum]CAE7364322.1 unnamed protein product [Symbiodinium sp. KB8]CAE7407575.1 unnamed protein product [Symbiodinium microadriaticum]